MTIVFTLLLVLVFAMKGMSKCNYSAHSAMADQIRPHASS
ncbi:MAG: hypothetical protein KZQ66_13995 [Candidatus Thiodiazotropha sp. (ex Lucinoma aequizonata)]|nr:hypothetical protein [Candidatus Thiodiazotropha sp. (ex Lucinoma aequizonata)]MCU7889977.1 hypothetical protein [Candidatus Thiodiazotropha sp. (ex Lucinoma aequizonata)]MCU7894452.1 hypothetical protein [Candidatus Thiodiazotropha sp. (ex Lucinoma aequizonata)]MCU7898481.1 hypothetical protein [Candidatus Thiodiazotropha sp. (ex Lucinoma aequizonata)]MCU7902968.1 hypothetical protein [Candidatus Thiodiazotropha sp. (ex Lucinoma aequizonata)]